MGLFCVFSLLAVNIWAQSPLLFRLPENSGLMSPAHLTNAKDGYKWWQIDYGNNASDAAGNTNMQSASVISLAQAETMLSPSTTFFQEGFEDTNFASRGWYDLSGGALSSTEKRPARGLWNAASWLEGQYAVAARRSDVSSPPLKQSM